MALLLPTLQRVLCPTQVLKVSTWPQNAPDPTLIERHEMCLNYHNPGSAVEGGWGVLQWRQIPLDNVADNVSIEAVEVL